MTTRKSLLKRKYLSVDEVEFGKWFTGYDGDIVSDHKPKCKWQGKHCTTSNKHTTRILKIKPTSINRGRSTPSVTFEDSEGFGYLLSMESVYNLLQKLSQEGVVATQEGYFVAEFCQVKQGANYFIDIVEERE